MRGSRRKGIGFDVGGLRKYGDRDVVAGGGVVDSRSRYSSEPLQISITGLVVSGECRSAPKMAL